MTRLVNKRCHLLCIFLPFSSVTAFTNLRRNTFRHRQLPTALQSDSSDDSERSKEDNQWTVSNADDNDATSQDWRAQLEAKEDGSFWSTFEPTDENSANDIQNEASLSNAVDDDAMAETWLDTLQSIAGQETEFILTEAERADKAREMMEWNFPSDIIASTLGIAIDTALEKEEVEGMAKYRKESFVDDIDMQTVESHALVDRDPETNEPIRSQMVYVDEYTCIGCTNCAMIAQSTFFMDQEHGRARVFQQWGDDEETIQVAIETCPVDCIHYIPYDELVELEIERRGQNLNPKARLVSQGELGSNMSHRVGGPVQFTGAQKISGNMAPRCNNCPSRGCKNCPMYGIGMNPEFVAREAKRKERVAKRRLQEERERQQKSAEL